jgi:hypothetical protein
MPFYLCNNTLFKSSHFTKFIFMPFRALFSLLFILIGIEGFTQGIRGRLTDAANLPVPFAAIYDETTYAGTTSNAEGFYDLKLEAGKHSLVFKALGYCTAQINHLF